MKLTYSKRNAERKSETKRLRLAGAIPSIIYTRGQESTNIAVQTSDFTSLVRNVKPGHLSAQVFSLVGEDGSQRRALLKGIQYEPTTYQVIHLDFEELVEGHKVNVKVPIEWVGAADAVGVKLGFVLRAVIRSMPVSCLPEHIPTSFQLDVRTMGARDVKRLKDLEIPENVRPLKDLNEVIVVMAKR
ncbi:MAG: 50S ribosomal protein L25/general stress protein Ctc [Parachlamydiaceae bacterium]|nr:50S ribosomal protein L25/general stress protein Ctc [Parachlamydiaceae bacterium]